MAQGVFQVFRRRLEVDEALGFADAPPPVLRAIFVADWTPSAAKLAFAGGAEMTKDVQALHRSTNLRWIRAIEAVA
jgi:uncharacterized protein (DUF2267 family)